MNAPALPARAALCPSTGRAGGLLRQVLPGLLLALALGLAAAGRPARAQPTTEAAPATPGQAHPAGGADADFLPAVEIEPIEVATGVYYVRGVSALGSAANGNFISNAGFVITADGVVLIDALGSPPLAELLRAAIARLTPKPVTHVIVTHYHADHVYGLQVFKDRGAQVIAQARGRDYLPSDTARRRLEESRLTLAPWVDERTRLVAADRWVEDRLTLEIGGRRFELEALGPAHTPDDLAVHLPELGVSFVGDLAFRGRIPFVGQADSRAWIVALDRLLARPLDLLVPGHGPHTTQARADLQLTRDYLVDLRRQMGRAARELLPFDEAYAQADWSRYRGLPLFQAAHRMNAYNTYLLMEREDE
ncbi:MBL fold metallo-hydrolase [Aquariibacter albus]|uniref:MBL fold metallo-hydrolase n=1 Tax=Aquariibacter albus TaxID=2759899 RepID=UPI002E2CD3F7|nr:MBL fold metallo-hydrolase [Aquariibacter albus]